MAAPRQEIEILREGIELQNPYNNTVFIQNLYKNRGLFETREGFGTLEEFNAPLNALNINSPQSPIDTTGTTYGLQKHLGSFSFVTEFGSKQIISVFLAFGYTAALKETTPLTGSKVEDEDLGDVVQYYCVNIYDYETDNSWQEVLYQHTAEQDQELQSTAFYHGYYETSNNLANWAQIDLAKDSTFFFKQYLGKIYFGSETGLWVYNPAQYLGNRQKNINNVNTKNELNDDLTNSYSETSLITPVTFKNGLFAEQNAFTYIQDSELSSFAAIEALEGRLIYASGKTIYFSDVGVPNAIIGDNSFTFHEMIGDITAIAVINSNIMVWSENQTWYYQPSNGVLLSSGRSVLVHDDIGCLGPQAVLFRQNRVHWVDRNGVYVSGTGLSSDEISLPIKRFFQSETVNPLIHYFVENGFIGLDDDRPDFVYDFSENLEKCHLSYDEQHEQLIFVVPQLNIAWIYKNGWYLWSFTSNIANDSGGNPVVGATTNCSEPWVTSVEDNVFVVGGLINFGEVVRKYNGSESADVVAPKYNSFRLFEWGRGGAQDGSTRDFNEGRRKVGFYRKLFEDAGGLTNPFRLFFDPCFKFGGKLTDDASNPTYYKESDEIWVLPIKLTPPSALTSKVSKYKVSFSFDDSRWQPIDDASSTGRDILFMVPTERGSTYTGYSPGAGIIGSQVALSTGAPTIVIEYDHSLATGSSYNTLFLSENNKNEMIYIPFRKINRTTNSQPATNIVTRMEDFEVEFDDGAGGVTTDDAVSVYDWQPGWYPLEDETTRTSGVDWVYKSDQIGMEESNQIKARGSYSVLSSRGEGQKIRLWNYGIFNSVAGSDYKDYVSQNIDFDGAPAIREDFVEVSNKASIRNRFNDGTTLNKRLFSNGNAIYGDNTNAAEGNYYVDTPEVDTIATSDSVRGGSVNYTFFGFLQDKANKLFIRSIKVALQAVSGRRRRGR